MGFALPSGVVNTDWVSFYATTVAGKFGPYVKQIDDQTLVCIDYSGISPAFAISRYTFTIDVTSNPQLVVSFANLDPAKSLLYFLLSGGIAGQQYTLSINATAGSRNRTDKLVVSIPSSGDCCQQINPVPSLLTELPLGEPTQGYANTGVRFFWGHAPPNSPNVLDQWYNVDNETLYEWINDGTKFFWEVIMSEGLVEEAPTDDIQYVRYNGYWIVNPIQQEAPADNQHYVRYNYGWLLLPNNPISTDAPSDGGYYVRRNAAWVLIPAGVQPSNGPPTMAGVADPGTGVTFSRWDHVHPTDTSRYSASNPSNYQSAAQVAALVAPMMPRAGGTFSGGVSFTAGAIFAGPANLSMGGGAAGQVFTSTGGGGLCQWSTPTPIPPPTIVSDTAPATPVAGTLWWDTIGGQMYMWYIDTSSAQWVPVVNEVGAYLSLAGGQVTGPIDLKAQTVAPSGAVLTINRGLGENVVTTLAGNVTSVVIVGWPISGFTAKMRLIVNNGGAFTMGGWPAGTIWPGGIAPVLTSGAGKKDIYLLMSDDGGTTIYGSIVGQDYR